MIPKNRNPHPKLAPTGDWSRGNSASHSGVTTQATVWLLLGKPLPRLFDCSLGVLGLSCQPFAVAHAVVPGRHAEFTRRDVARILVVFGRSRVLREEMLEIGHSRSTLLAVRIGRRFRTASFLECRNKQSRIDLLSLMQNTVFRRIITRSGDFRMA